MYRPSSANKGTIFDGGKSQNRLLLAMLKIICRSSFDNWFGCDGRVAHWRLSIVPSGFSQRAIVRWDILICSHALCLRAP